VIRETPNVVGQGGERLASALSLFSNAFEAFEQSGCVVRDFPKANDTNILIFGYLLEAVRSAATVERFERRHCDHSQMLRQIISNLEWAGHQQAANTVRNRMTTAASEVRSGEPYEVLCRLAHMRRFLSFAWAVFLEMHLKGIWPDHDDLEVYRQAFHEAVKPGDTASYLLDVRELVEDISAEVRIFDGVAADRIEGFKGWKRSYF
jgi:hypothetical protein